MLLSSHFLDRHLHHEPNSAWQTMRVRTVNARLRNLVNQIKSRNMPKRVRTPNCTHLDMDRVYGQDQQCNVCGRPPSIGFLYECRQDYDVATLHDLLAEDDDDLGEVTKSDVRMQLEWLGLSESVISTAEQGHYTHAQLEKLKAQKKELQQIISDSLQASHINNAAARLAALAQTPSNHDGASSSTVIKTTSPPICTLRACHSCRPYYRDRIYISFQSVFNADFPPMTRHDVQILPTKSAQIMKSIGTTTHYFHSLSTSDTSPISPVTSKSWVASTDAPPTASTTSTTSNLTFKTTQTDLDDISAQRRPRRRFYKMGHRSSGDIALELSRQATLLTRQGLKSAFQGIFRPSRASSSSGSNITLPLPRTGMVRDSNTSRDVGDFDLPSLRKVRREKERNEYKRGVYMGGYEGVHADRMAGPAVQGAATFPPSAAKMKHGGVVANSDHSMDGSEVEVDGGVALTEEAVETHTPDILAIDISGLKNAAMVHDVEMDDDDFGADIGLQSIMAQV